MKIDVLICTFRRAHIKRTVESVRSIIVPDGIEINVLVVDNDDQQSGYPFLDGLLEDPEFDLKYLHAPGRNISIARNACLNHAHSDWIIFLDDDEVVEKDWLVKLWQRQNETEVDGVFGVVKSVFPENAPPWMRELDMHAPGPQRTGNVVKTGGAGNALLRWRGTPWVNERFDIARGKTGGEDTEFFYRIGRLGAKFEIASDAIAREPVTEQRQSFGWLIRRRFRVGQIYVVSTTGGIARVGLAFRAATKALFSFVTSMAFFWNSTKWRYWYLRGVFHSGVVAGCLNISEVESYG